MALDTWIKEYERRTWQTASAGTIRYALIGLGWWTSDIAIPALKDSTLCEATVLVSSSRGKAERVAAKHDISHGITYEEYREGVAADAYDAVYVATPNAHHLEYVETAAELDKAALCEKPMEATVDRAMQMVDTCDRHDTLLMVAYRMHTDPAVRRAKDLIRGGLIGEPVQVYGDNTQPLLEMIPDEDQWRLTPELTGYGTSVMDLGIYSINTTRYVLDRDPVSARACMASQHGAFDGLDDERASFLLEFEDEIQFVSTASQRAHADTQLKITGTDGQVELRPAFHGEVGLRVSAGDLTVEVKHDAFDAEEEMREEFDYFADRLLTGAEIEANGRHGLRDMEIIEAIHRAAKTGTVVEL